MSNPKRTRRPSLKDPQAAREAARYENPIASRELILKYLESCGKPARFIQIAVDLKIKGEEAEEALRRRLKAMCRDGQIVQNRREGFGLIHKMNLITGQVIGHRDGFGFLVPDDNSPDLTLSPRQMRLLFDGDRALVRVVGVDYRGRREATIVEVLERNTQTIVGRYVKEMGMAYLVPENKRISQNILITENKSGSAIKEGEMITVTITSPPTESRQATGYVSEVLGDHLAPGMEIDVAVRAHHLPHTWSKEVLADVKKLKPTLPESAKKNRLDLRNLPFVTIDGEDAQDFDDAVYCEKIGRRFKLLVAIADVSHYVTPGSALDQDAQQRGTSVYFPGQVIPMLPEILSNELCSLKPEVDRLSMVCEMIISSKGKIISADFHEAIIHSHARLTYNQVAEHLYSNFAVTNIPSVNASIENLYKLYQILLKNREERGAMDFDTVETQIIFGKNRKIEKIIPRTRNDAHRLIEECMLAANVATAEFLQKAGMPILYRVHNGPKTDKLDKLRGFLNELGLSLPGGKQPEPHDYAKLLELVEDRPDSHLIQTMLLRSLSQAVYTPEANPHFGLAYKLYTHFTSPIRRYPDLLIHRAVKYCLAKKKPELYPYDDNKLIYLGEHCSLTERRADDATRDAVSSLKCQFLHDKVGKEFFGVISHITGFGFFVELSEIYIEGLVHVSTLTNDYYIFDVAKQRLRGEKSGVHYRIGDKVRVLIAAVNVEERKIDFELLQKNDASPKKKKKRSQKKST